MPSYTIEHAKESLALDRDRKLVVDGGPVEYLLLVGPG